MRRTGADHGPLTAARPVGTGVPQGCRAETGPTDRRRHLRRRLGTGGAWWSGLYMLHRLRGLGLAERVYEAGDGVGGTWYWNRYPGARCDVESMEYSYSFSDGLQQEWHWTERYAGQPEILRYINHVADRFNLRSDIQFNTRVVSATFDDETSTWTLRTDTGETVTTPFLVMAAGTLSTANIPAIA